MEVPLEVGTLSGRAPVASREPGDAAQTATDRENFWLDDVPGDPGKLGELIGMLPNLGGLATLTHTFEGVIVRLGDVVFAVVPFSDFT